MEEKEERITPEYAETAVFQQRKGVSIRHVNFALIALALVIGALMVISVLKTTRSYQSMRESTARYLSCREDATSLMDASDYLTEAVREFVITGEAEPLENFFREIHETRRRDIALENLGLHFADTEAYRFLEAALKRSNALAETERYAMCLAIEGRGGSLADYPDELQAIDLTAEDAALSPEEKSHKAIELVFGRDYQDEKQGIRTEVAMCLNTLINQTDELQAESAEHFASLLHRQTLPERRDLITLNFYLWSQKEKDRLSPRKRFTAFTEDTNRLLSACGFGELYAAIPYECFLMMCLLTNDPLAVYTDVWERSYQE